jgi:AbrB family looped-hinge helix DNA binding protein
MPRSVEEKHCETTKQAIRGITINFIYAFPIAKGEFRTMKKVSKNQMQELIVIGETGELSAKGQVVIPIKVREEISVKEGDRLEFIRLGDEIIVRPIKRKSIKNVLGSWKNAQPLKDVKDLRDQYRKELIDDDLARQQH